MVTRVVEAATVLETQPNLSIHAMELVSETQGLFSAGQLSLVAQKASCA